MCAVWAAEQLRFRMPLETESGLWIPVLGYDFVERFALSEQVGIPLLQFLELLLCNTILSPDPS